MPPLRLGSDIAFESKTHREPHPEVELARLRQQKATAALQVGFEHVPEMFVVIGILIAHIAVDIGREA